MQRCKTIWRSITRYTVSLGLAFAAAVAAVAPSNATFISVAAAHFLAWDANHDGVLSAQELDTLMADPGVTNDVAAAVAALKRASRSRTFKLPPLTLENITALANSPREAGKPDLAKMYREGLSRIDNTGRRTLFGSGLPQLKTIHQGKLGNCFCLAPLGAMLQRSPEDVARMFSMQPNGTCQLSLGTNTVTVQLPTDAELAMTSSNEHDGIWINLYEKGLGQLRNEARPPEQRAGLAIDALARGGSAGTMLAYITGHEITRFSFKFSKDASTSKEQRETKLKELRCQLAEAATAKRLMTCGTLKTTTPGLTPNHAYAVLDYDASSDSVTLWNPHGGKFSPKGPANVKNGYPQQDGILKVPVPDFVQQFSGMAFEASKGGNDAKSSS